ncbi:hypothetical protein [Sphingomonas sp.]|uniref:hypothetical protein n=1 Tax=Sphingomonas sp. TaxID=28214 RepID=UPI001B0E5018|nr:hypothetical protein [Sphingomonas sp.]MBO9715090.1 hypothetical protein [Sphingomonas sp.]
MASLRRIGIPVVLTAAVALLGGTLALGRYGQGEAQVRRPLPIRAGPAHLIGRLALAPSQELRGTAALVELPDIKVELRNAASGGGTVGSDVTLIDGKFDLVAPGPGIYVVCAIVADKPSCGNRIQAAGKDIAVGNVVIRPNRAIVWGTVLTGDRRPCWMRDHFFGVDFSTRVEARQGSAVVGTPVRANVQGEYALLDVPTGALSIKASCEKSTAGASVSLAGVVRRDLAFANHAPKVDAISAVDAGGAAARRADPGDKLTVVAEAKDRDGDKLEFLWRATDGNGALAGGSTDAKQGWKMPATEGMRTVYLLARDGLGGYAYRRFDLSAAKRLVFSGQVIDEASGAPITGATVTVGGATVSTNASGWFRTEVAPVKADRYILNIHHPAYAATSRVYSAGSTGETYDLMRATVASVPAGGKLVFRDSGQGKCGTGGDTRKKPVRQLAAPQLLGYSRETGDFAPVTGTKANARLTAQLRAAAQPVPCDTRGTQIAIDPGGLVDARGKAAAGVTGAVLTFDPTRRSLPGDYGAMGADGNATRLFSYGAVYAEFRGSGGEKLNLAPGQAAELRIPVPAAQRASAPPVIALWSYDEDRGIWVEEGDANLQDTPTGAWYVGKTKHFSSINMDIKITGGTCARFHVPAGSFSGWTNLKLRAYVTFGGTNSQTFETPLNGDEMHAVFRIPFGAATAPNTLRFEVTGTFGGSTAILLNNIVDIDSFAVPTSGAYSYPYPYNECGTAIELAPPAGVVPAYGKDASGRPYFLTGPAGGFNPAPADYDPTVYYTQIDPGNAKTTLGDWWGLNGFDATTGQAGTGTNFTEAHYLNNNDLGFGRDMHCINNGAKLACYVTNYGLPDQDPTNADLPVAKRGATVTMEYDPGAAADRQVQFYVFGGGVAGSPRIKYADLDGFGPKPVPQLCTVCHGGKYNVPAKLALNSVFREFDLPSFKYPSGHVWDYGADPAPMNPASPTQAEFQNFAKLNKMVHDIAPGNKIGNLITAWYTGGFGGPDFRPHLPDAPTGWNNANPTEVALYHGPYGKGCRACHIARSLDFDASSYTGTSYVVCGIGRVMPNAVVTYKNFWADTSSLLKYEIANSIPPGACKND